LEPVTSGTAYGEAVAEDISESVQYWPTKVSEVLHITCDGSFDKLEVIDMTGRPMVMEAITGKKSIEVNVRGLANAVHIVRMSGSAKRHAFRIVKE
jgi:hypothetical protein